MKKQNQTISEEHLARAKAKDVPVSTKHSIEICRYLRYKTTNLAKKILEDTISIKKPIPFKRFKRDIGHKPGMAAGRFPKKAAKEMLKLVKSAETNAQFKGLNTSSLKIIKILANKASVPVTGGRRNTSTKRTNLEIEVKEKREKKKETRQEDKKPIKKEGPKKTEEKTETAKSEIKKPVKKEIKTEKAETIKKEPAKEEVKVEKTEENKDEIKTEKEAEEVKKPAESVKETKTGEPEK